ncbi:MAG: TIGR03557 family F420-dependent LLM class oxidoreductase [Microbacterium sp.]
MQIGFAAMLEQAPPGVVLERVQRAEAAGFRGVMASDHFQPWLPRHGAASHVWSMLGAIGTLTSGELGPGVTTPAYRTHPAVVAQAAATLGALFPGRAWLGIGSGEALNEHIAGQYWPEAPERIERMFEAVEVIRKLFAASRAGRDVRHSGPFFRLESTRLWTMPQTAPDICIATAGPHTARRAGRVADGLVTTAGPRERLAILLERFAEGAREAGRDAGSMRRIVQLHLSWAPTDEEALAAAVAEWPLAGMRFGRADVRSPFDVEQLSRLVRPDDVAAGIVASADPDVHRAAIQGYVDLGFDRVYLHNVASAHDEWIDVFGREVIPRIQA